MMPIIEVRHVTKVFPARRGPRDLRGGGGVAHWLFGRKENTFTALHDISLDVETGESLGIIGRNGSGKSTLLSIIAGVTLPTSGSVTVRGRVASLLELGAGFNPILTGRENIYLNAGMLGMRHAQVDAVFDDIVRFSGIEAFIDQPVETYSSGMYVRIGFSVAAFVNPDIFLADEVLAVGDAEFQRKCRVKIGELREQGKTIVFVSHDLGSVSTLCERIVLLDGGRAIQRETPHKTVMFYLRQVGMEKGVHTFQSGDGEAIHCDGRVSLFHRQEEVTAPSGLRMQLSSLGQDHHSEEAEWKVTEKRPDGCDSRGRMLRLPLVLCWELRFEGSRLLWKITLDCERATPLSAIQVFCFLPTAFTRWVYGDLTGVFPEIQPQDASWTVMASPEAKASDAAALPEPGAPLPPAVFHLVRHNPHFGFFWANSEYMLYSRALCANARFPEHDCIFTPGVHELVTLEINLSIPQERVLEHVCSDRILSCGDLRVRFEQGQLRLRWKDREITAYLHLYVSMLIEHLWNDSQGLHWGGVTALEDGIRFAGESRRFPFRQEWEIRRMADGFRLCVWLDALEPLEIQECHTTLVIPPLYDRWETGLEQGVFPPFAEDAAHWTHCNRSYAPSARIAAWSDALPSITMTADDASPEVCMTAINTTCRENARALQALRPSGQGRLRFSPGRHRFFSGTICVVP